MFERNQVILEFNDEEVLLLEELAELLQQNSIQDVLYFALSYMLCPEDEAVDKINGAIEAAVTHPHEFPLMAERYECYDPDEDESDLSLTDLIAHRMIQELDDENELPIDIDEMAAYLIKIFDKSVLKNTPKFE